MYSRYLLIKRWKKDGAPDSIRALESGDKVRLQSGESFEVDHVGIGSVLLKNKGWVDWREIELQSEEG